jgi:hypothetical protein
MRAEPDEDRLAGMPLARELTEIHRACPRHVAGAEARVAGPADDLRPTEAAVEGRGEYCRHRRVGIARWSRSDMHTVMVVAAGFALFGLCALVGRVLGGTAGTATAALVFLPLWLVGAGINMLAERARRVRQVLGDAAVLHRAGAGEARSPDMHRFAAYQEAFDVMRSERSGKVVLDWTR